MVCRNTHSKHGDNRMQSIIDCAKAIHIDVEKEIINCNTTDEAAEVLIEMHLDKLVFQEVADQCKRISRKMSKDQIEFECIIFSTIYGTLGKTENADLFLKEIKIMIHVVGFRTRFKRLYTAYSNSYY